MMCRWRYEMITLVSSDEMTTWDGTTVRAERWSDGRVSFSRKDAAGTTFRTAVVEEPERDRVPDPGRAAAYPGCNFCMGYASYHCPKCGHDSPYETAKRAARDRTQPFKPIDRMKDEGK